MQGKTYYLWRAVFVHDISTRCVAWQDEPNFRFRAFSGKRVRAWRLSLESWAHVVNGLLWHIGEVYRVLSGASRLAYVFVPLIVIPHNRRVIRVVRA